MKIQKAFYIFIKSVDISFHCKSLTLCMLLLVNTIAVSEVVLSGGAFDFVRLDPLEPNHIYAFNTPLDGNIGNPLNRDMILSLDKGKTWEFIQHGPIRDHSALYVWQTESIGYSNIVFGNEPGILFDARWSEHDTLGNKLMNASIMKSTDQGKSWSSRVELPLITNEDGRTTNVLSLAVDPNNRLNIFGIVGYQTDDGFRSGRGFSFYWKRALAKSNDGGDSWSIISPTFTSRKPTLLIASDEHSTIYAGANFGLYKSIDAGINWQKIYQIKPFPCDTSIEPACATDGIEELKISSTNPDIIYIRTAHGSTRQYLRSNDGGVNWTVIFNQTWFQEAGIGIHSLIPDPIDDNIVYADGYQYNPITHSHYPIIGRSLDKGATWQIINLDFKQYFTLNDLTIDPSNNSIIYLTIDGKVFISRDGLTNIEQLNGASIN